MIFQLSQSNFPFSRNRYGIHYDKPEIMITKEIFFTYIYAVSKVEETCLPTNLIFQTDLSCEKGGKCKIVHFSGVKFCDQTFQQGIDEFTLSLTWEDWLGLYNPSH